MNPARSRYRVVPRSPFGIYATARGALQAAPWEPVRPCPPSWHDRRPADWERAVSRQLPDLAPVWRRTRRAPLGWRLARHGRRFRVALAIAGAVLFSSIIIAGLTW